MSNADKKLSSESSKNVIIPVILGILGFLSPIIIEEYLHFHFYEGNIDLINYFYSRISNISLINKIMICSIQFIPLGFIIILYIEHKLIYTRTKFLILFITAVSINSIINATVYISIFNPAIESSSTSVIALLFAPIYSSAAACALAIILHYL